MPDIFSGVHVMVRYADRVLSGLRVSEVRHDEQVGMRVCEVYTAEYGRETVAAENVQDVNP